MWKRTKKTLPNDTLIKNRPIRNTSASGQKARCSQLDLAMPSTQIRLKRVYESASADDGVRILVERLWPRGLTKADAAIDHWVKDVAPTSELRTWFGHRPARWQEFRTRYRLELNKNRSAVSSLRELCSGQRVTFIFATKDVFRNGAVVLKEYLDAVKVR